MIKGLNHKTRCGAQCSYLYECTKLTHEHIAWLRPFHALKIYDDYSTFDLLGVINVLFLFTRLINITEILASLLSHFSDYSFIFMFMK